MEAGRGWSSSNAEEGRIDELARQVEKIWRANRPNIMRLYDKMQQAERRTREAARLVRSSAELFFKNGVPRDQADNLAMYEFVYLPDIEQQEEAEILASLQQEEQKS